MLASMRTFATQNTADFRKKNFIEHFHQYLSSSKKQFNPQTRN